MLTPSFHLGQTEDAILLTVHAPLSNIAQTELTVVDDVLIFYSSPYYLRLHLPGKVMEIEGETGKYHSDTQDYSFVLKKVHPGEEFKDLDLIGKLLIPSKKHQVRPEISIYNGGEVVPSSDPESDDDLGYIKQEIVNVHEQDLAGYGFANKGQGIGQQLRYEFREILDFVDIGSTSIEDRSLMREADELSKFSEDYYLADLMEPAEINVIINWEPNLPVSPDKVKFTTEEKERLKMLGNRDYLLDCQEKKIALFSLIDILFAFAYNERTTFGEETVESAWTINKLSSTLSWLQSFNSMEEVKIACARRSLIFPLYRHWNLTVKVFEDTFRILKLGRRQILKCFLQIHRMFACSEPRYLLNELYVTDYCIWIQKISENKIQHLAELFEQVTISKDDVRLELNELEEAALMVQEEEEIGISNMLLDMKLCERNSNGDSDSDYDYEDSEEIVSSSDSVSSSGGLPASNESSALDSDDVSSGEE